MNYNNIIEEVGKYHYLLNTSSKVLLLSSSNDKQEAEAKAINKIRSKLKALVGQSICYIELEKIDDDIYKRSKTAVLTGIGGVIQVDVRVYEISGDGSLFMNDFEDRNTRLWITEEYLNDHGEISTKLLKNICRKVMTRKLNIGALQVYKI